MPIIEQVRGFTPKIDATCFIAKNAVIVGNVTLEENCTVWFNTVLRGDVNAITVGKNTNIQDGVIVHCTYQKTSTIIGNNVSIGHNAVIHGCTIEDDVLIGMGAIVMDNAVVGKGSVVAAGAVVLNGTNIESGMIYAGIPAKKVKKADTAITELIRGTARRYPMYAKWFQ